MEKEDLKENTKSVTIPVSLLKRPGTFGIYVIIIGKIHSTMDGFLIPKEIVRNSFIIG